MSSAVSFSFSSVNIPTNWLNTSRRCPPSITSSSSSLNISNLPEETSDATPASLSPRDFAKIPQLPRGTPAPPPPPPPPRRGGEGVGGGEFEPEIIVPPH